MPRVEIDEAALNNYLAAAPTRQAQLTALGNQVIADAASTITKLQNLDTPNAGVTPAVGAKVSQAEVDTYMANKPTKLAGESNSAYNARVTQWYKDQPHSGLTPEQEAAGATLQWVRTGSGGEGQYKVVYPIGVGFDPTTGQPLAKSNTQGVNKTVDRTVKNTDGSTTVYYSDGTTATLNSENTTGTGLTGTKSTSKSLVSTNVDPNTGAVVGYFSDGSQQTLTAGGLSKTETDAYALLEQTFKNYGLDSLVPVIQDYMKKNLGSEQAALQLRQTEQYKTRFAGNQIRLAQGQNALSESAYLTLENEYLDTLNAYGLKNFFGTDRTSQIANMAKVIGGDISSPEFTSRVSTVVDRVKNADPAIKGQLKAYYNIDDADLIKYYLNPDQNLAELKKKTLTAEIGAAGANQGLTVGETAARALGEQGVTQAQAQQGYKTVAEVLPTASKLGDIYASNQLNYGQAEAEADVFGTSGAASAQRKRKQMAALESAAFSGRSGVDLEQVSPLGARTRGYSF